MEKQAINLAKRIQLEETLHSVKLKYKAYVIEYNDFSHQISEMKLQQLMISDSVNKLFGEIKSLESDIELLNKTNKEIDDKLEEEFKEIK